MLMDHQLCLGFGFAWITLCIILPRFHFCRKPHNPNGLTFIKRAPPAAFWLSPIDGEQRTFSSSQIKCPQFGGLSTGKISRYIYSCVDYGTASHYIIGTHIDGGHEPDRGRSSWKQEIRLWFNSDRNQMERANRFTSTTSLRAYGE